MTSSMKLSFKKRLRSLKKLGKVAHEIPTKESRENYLQRAYSLARRRHKELADLRDDPPPLQEIIEDVLRRTFPERKRRWDYSQALKYAAFKNVPLQRSIAFIEEKGGIKGCCRRMTKLRRSGKI